MTTPCDIAIINGTVLDPATNTKELGSVFIKDGLILQARGDEAARRAFDASGMYIMPGLIDSHTHTYVGGSDIGTNPAISMIPQGVTMAVDAGSAGTGTLPGLIQEMATAPLRMKALLNVTPTGLATYRVPSRVNPAEWDVSRIARAFRDYGPWLTGLKILAGKESMDALVPLDAALALAADVGVPLAVHCTNPPESLGAVCDRLRPGDILVHCFHGKGSTILGGNGKVRPEILAARERGVVIDASNGSGHFSFSVAEAALAQGFLPDVIASDLTSGTAYEEPVYGLPHIMSKYLALGMSLMDVVRCCTSAAAIVCGCAGSLGTLAPGALGDLTVLEEVRKEVVFYDTAGDHRTGTKYLVPRLTVIRGEVLFRSHELPSQKQ